MNSINRRSLLKGLALLALPVPTKASFNQHHKTLPWHNWSGALACQPAGRISPASVAELSEYLRRSAGSIRPVGSGHSFSPLVPTDGHLIVIDQLSGLLGFDDKTHHATFGAGTLLSEIGPILRNKSRALNNMPDIDRQTIAGAISTATHGTGLDLGCLSDDIVALQLVTANGDILDLNAGNNPDLFNAARVSLGALGVVTAVTFQTRKHYRLKAVNRVIPMRDALDGFVAAASQHRHYELFPLVYGDYAMELIIDETDEPINNPLPTPEEEAEFGQMLSILLSVPVSLRKAAINTIAKTLPTTQAVDDSHDILSNVRTDRFNEMEYSIDLDAGIACLDEVLKTIERDRIDVAFPLEVRSVKSDDTWLGMSSGETPHITISIHRGAGYDYTPYFDAVEPIFKKYGGRPHWGKVHSLDAAALKKLYPRFDDFAAVRGELDPKGQLLNNHLAKILIA